MDMEVHFAMNGKSSTETTLQFEL